jgi:atypical dual specificity phosphatase
VQSLPSLGDVRRRKPKKNKINVPVYTNTLYLLPMWSFTLEGKEEESIYARICENVFLSGVEGVDDAQRLHELGIKAIVSLGSVNGEVYPRHPGIHYLHIVIEDNKFALIERFFRLTSDFITLHANQTEAVLVHCSAGVSRSATIVIAHLMQTRGLSLDTALTLVREKRSIVHPNDGFVEQLRHLEHPPCR